MIKDLIPDRTRIFLAALYIWTWILFKLSLIVNVLLGLFLSCFPNDLIPNIKSKTPVKIIEANDDDGNIITNKLKLYMNMYWDKTMCDDKGGVNLDRFASYLNTTMIWVNYLLDCEKEKEEENNNISGVSSDSDEYGYYNKLYNRKKKVYESTPKQKHSMPMIAIINIGKKVIRKISNAIETDEDINFGEINFH
jgi:hypothetical protein